MNYTNKGWTVRGYFFYISTSAINQVKYQRTKLRKQHAKETLDELIEKCEKSKGEFLHSLQVSSEVRVVLMRWGEILLQSWWLFSLWCWCDVWHWHFFCYPNHIQAPDAPWQTIWRTSKHSWPHDDTHGRGICTISLKIDALLDVTARKQSWMGSRENYLLRNFWPVQNMCKTTLTSDARRVLRLSRKMNKLNTLLTLLVTGTTKD